MRRCPVSGENCFEPGCHSFCQDAAVVAEVIDVTTISRTRRVTMTLSAGHGYVGPARERVVGGGRLDALQAWVPVPKRKAA